MSLLASEALKAKGKRLYSGATGHTQEGIDRYQNLLQKGLVEEINPQIFMYKKLGGKISLKRNKPNTWQILD